GAVGHCPRATGDDCAFLLPWACGAVEASRAPGEDRQRKRGWRLCFCGATIGRPHHHEEYASWRLQVYQEYPPGAICIIQHCEGPLDQLRATEEVGGCLGSAVPAGVGERGR